MAQDVETRRIGITGATGFVGKRFQQLCHEKNIAAFPFSGDLTRPEDVQRFFSAHSVKIVVHLAGRFAPPFDDLLHANVLTTQTLLEQGIPLGLEKIIFSSTGAVYGEPIREESFEDDPLQPNTLYGLSKLYTEECIRYYARCKSLQYVILRFPNIYGPGQTKGVLFQLLQSIRTKGIARIAGDGEQVRDYVHVDDACAALLRALEYSDSDTFNITSQARHSLHDVVAKLQTLSSCTVEHVPADNNLIRLALNGEKAKAKLGFSAQYPTLNLHNL